MEDYWLWLCSVPGLYHAERERLLLYFGTPRAVYEAPEKAFSAWLANGCAWMERLLEFRRRVSPGQACHRLREQGIQFISREHPAFPERLLRIPDCPAGLFYRGRLPRHDRPAVAVVGARRCSSYGRGMAEKLGEALALAGAEVVSGLAVGIDGYAQKAALSAGGASFGVLGCGADICYPPENRRLYQELQEKGGLLSEYPPGTPPLRHHFPMRNRIISGLADTVVVVEARKQSGSLITADLALDQGRDVYAVPGRSGDVLSYGCNHLIEQGAGLVLSAESLLEHLGLPLGREEFSRKKKLGLAPEEKWVYSNLDLLPRGLEELVEATDFPAGKLSGILLRLELQGLAAEISKNHYARLK